MLIEDIFVRFDYTESLSTTGQNSTPHKYHNYLKKENMNTRHYSLIPPKQSFAAGSAHVRKPPLEFTVCLTSIG